MRRMGPAVLTVCLLLLAAVGRARWNENGAATRPTSGAQPYWIKITFGLDETEADWDGRLTVTGGELLQLAPWAFEHNHQFDSASRSWKCSTAVNNVRELSSFAEPYRGLLLELKAGPETRVQVETAQGDLVVEPAQLAAGSPALFLEGRASAERLGTAAPVLDSRFAAASERQATSQTEDDEPSIAVDASGRRWVAWVAYDQRLRADQLLTRCLDDPGGSVESLPVGSLVHSPQLATAGDGTLWLFWSAPLHADGANWNIYAVARGRAGWNAPRAVTSSPGNEFFLRAAAGPRGDIWLTWQSFADGDSDIMAKRLMDGEWSADLPVADSDANEWEPALSVDQSGTAWIAYDSYENGNYDVYLRSVSVDRSGRAQRSEAIPIAVSEDFEAHAAVEATLEGTVWIAYDAGGPNWGKDMAKTNPSSHLEYADTLHANRRLELRAYSRGQVWKPRDALPQQLDTLRPKSVAHKYMGEVRRFYDLPQLARDANGRLWLFFRLNRQGYAEDPRQAAWWEVFATTWVDGRWLEPILLPQSGGRQEQRMTFARPLARQSEDANGLHCAWSTGHHMIDMRQQLRTGVLPPVAGPVADPPLEPFEPPRAARQREERIRSWTMRRQGRDLQVYFGDLHRHTEISWCYPTIDGTVTENYRYAIDAARMDFLAVTDHSRDTDPYPWWYTRKAADFFNQPGKFAGIYGYERSNDTPGGGHRNVFFVDRDWEVNRSDHHYKHAGESPPGRTDPTAALYPTLRGKRAFTAPHTPAYSQMQQRGTWSYNDPEVEPVAEIFQGFRQSYERPAERVSEQASLWYALRKGYRLGFIASSDHISTHISYACVWAEGAAREQLFEGFLARRTYAATDKILLDFRIGDAVMGEEVKVHGKPELTIRARGTTPVDELEIIGPAGVLATLHPRTKDVQERWVDEAATGGPTWYYVRLVQSDGNQAWGSPIWVND